jgi:hypothetical protein
VINSSIVRGQCWDHDHLRIPLASGKRFSVGCLGLVTAQEQDLITIQLSRNLLHLRQVPLLFAIFDLLLHSYTSTSRRLLDS